MGIGIGEQLRLGKPRLLDALQSYLQRTDRRINPVTLRHQIGDLRLDYFRIKEPVHEFIRLQKYPAIREFTDQLVISGPPRWRRQPDSAKGVTESWSALVARLARLRHAGTPRRIRLSRGAAVALAEYVDQIGQIRPTGRLLKNAPLLAAKNALIFESCVTDPVREVSTETMRHAIALSGSFLRESGELASRCVKAQKVKEFDDEIARMYEKVRNLEGEGHVPVSVSKLRRTYDRQDKAIHQPVLEQLLRSGKVRQREDGLLEGGGEADEREPIDRRTAD